MYDIKLELLSGFSNWWTPYAEPSPDEEFWLLSGETEDNISDGRIVQVTFRHIQDNRIICTFDSRLKAMVMLHNYSDDGFYLECSEDIHILFGHNCIDQLLCIIKILKGYE